MAAWAVEIAQAQSDDEQAGRIVARRLDDGRTEFGWQPAGAARVLPSLRYFPTDAQVDRWLNSSPVEVGGAEIGRINARLRDDGRIEFAFTPTDGERIEPPARYFPVDAQAGRWLRSTEIAISAQPTIGQTTPPADSDDPSASSDDPPASSDDPPASSDDPPASSDDPSASSDGPPASSDDPPADSDDPATGFVAVSAGDWHTCAIRAGSGAIECWGNNEYGQTDAPAGSFSAVSAGYWHMCAIWAGSGAITCWGNNVFGETDAPAGPFTAVSAGGAHTCGLRTNGAIECWGTNSTILWTTPEAYEEVYDGRATPPAGSFSAVSAGAEHTCAIRAESGTIECWGGNFGLLDDIPTGRFTAVSAGGYHTCAIRESGEITCWGSNAVGVTLNPETEEFEEIYGGQIDAPTGRFSAVVAGDYHTCAIREGGAIECWGLNEKPQWSEDGTEWVYSGQTDAPTGSFTAISAGSRHACAIRDTGAIECWGSNEYGQTDAPAP